MALRPRLHPEKIKKIHPTHQNGHKHDSLSLAGALVDKNRAISEREPLNREVWYVEMYSKSGYNSLFQNCIVADSRLWVLIPREPMVIHIERPSGVGVHRNQEASIPASPGTKARHDPVDRRPKRRRSSDEYSASKWYSAAHEKSIPREIAQLDDVGEIYNQIRGTFKMNDPTGPFQRMSKKARHGSATTDPSRSVWSMLDMAGGNKDRVLKKVQKKVQFDEGNGEPTDPVPRADIADPEALCGQFDGAVQISSDTTDHARKGSTSGESAGDGLPGSG
ncbi:hypothetical protein F5883DRAFT_554137 [Diaporthe sp. PMI_573]|nr:hypothetical protein F5883DRAFT_554137 [Diaporthaceae sp. PMI_573]